MSITAFGLFIWDLGILWNAQEKSLNYDIWSGIIKKVVRPKCQRAVKKQTLQNFEFLWGERKQ